jgi:hypothetical protein
MATWKVLTLGAALTGLGVAGAGVALADERAQPAAPQPITVSVADPAGAPLAAGLSPESADSPFESPVDSPESPFDSPDDVAPAPGVHGDDTPDDDTPDDDTPDDDD